MGKSDMEIKMQNTERRYQGNRESEPVKGKKARDKCPLLIKSPLTLPNPHSVKRAIAVAAAGCCQWWAGLGLERTPVPRNIAVLNGIMLFASVQN